MTAQGQADQAPQPHPDQPETWTRFYPLIMAHDVGRTRDRSTAVVGGGSPFDNSVIGILDLRELPHGLYGSARASALAAVDHYYLNNTLIIADLSNDESYGEDLYNTFGPRVIGLHITSRGNGMNWQHRPVGGGAMLVYTIGRTALIEQFHSLVATRMVRFVKGSESVRAYDQLANLQTEMREGGTVYSTLPGQHDDLGISCCMLAWACRHPHLTCWATRAFADRMPRPKPTDSGWGPFT